MSYVSSPEERSERRQLFLLPLLWLIGGTALFGVYSVGKTASYKRSSFINTVLGTVRCCSSENLCGSSEEENHQEKLLWLERFRYWVVCTTWLHRKLVMPHVRTYVLNVSFVWSIATLFFVGVVYTFGFGVLVKFWVVRFSFPMPGSVPHGRSHCP